MEVCYRRIVWNNRYAEHEVTDTIKKTYTNNKKQVREYLGDIIVNSTHTRILPNGPGNNLFWDNRIVSLHHCVAISQISLGDTYKTVLWCMREG